MGSEKETNSKDSSELKSFMHNMRQENLMKLVELNQLKFKEKCNYLSQKCERYEEDVLNKTEILQQNSHLIDKFKNKLQELFDQNSELFKQQQALRQENEHLHAQLKCSEDKFAQLDIFYDQQITDLSEKNIEIEQQLSELKSSEELRLNQFDQTQIDLNKKLSKAEERILQQKIDYEERLEDIQKKLTIALEENNKASELQKNDERIEAQEAFNTEKSHLITLNEDLKATVEDLQKRLTVRDKSVEQLKKNLQTKENEIEDLYFKFKTMTRNSKLNSSGSHQASKFPSTLNHVSPDDPKPLDSSSDSPSDASTVSVYKSRKRRVLSSDSDKEERKIDHWKYPTFGPRDKKKFKMPYIEVPDSPVVSSSAFGK